MKEHREEYFDCVLSFGAELDNTFPDDKERDAVIKETGGFYEELEFSDAKETDGFYNGRNSSFKDEFNYWRDYEFTDSAKEIYLEKDFLGRWDFCVCKPVEDIVCEECEAPPESKTTLKGSIYLTHISTDSDSQKNKNLGKKAKKHPSHKNTELQINKVVLIDIVFMEVPRHLINNLFAVAQHSQLSLHAPNNSDSSKSDKSLKALLERFNLNIITAPKSLVSGCSVEPLKEDELMNILSHETQMAEMDGYTLECTQIRNCFNENLSDFSELNIVMSSCSNVQQFHTTLEREEVLEKLKGINLKKRFKNIALTIMVTNIVMYKVTKLRLIQKTIGKCFNMSKENTFSISKDDLIDINFHIVMLSYMWYEDSFIYPITEAAASKIHSKFELDKYKTELSQMQNTFENYMNMFFNREEELNNNKKQRVLKIITILSGISVVLSVQLFLFEFENVFQRLIGLFSGTFFIIFLVGLSHMFPSKKK